MTSLNDVSKTNEFLRRRKLRLQQVREQSKDIAKEIRQRAKVEKLRHGVDAEAKKEKEYFKAQEKLVKRLELLYAKSLQNVGASHKNASDVNQIDVVEKQDLSKLRGKEAVNELRKKKQEKLDEQKKLLDRKLHARELANELSREKSSSVAKTVTKQAKKTDPASDTYITNKSKINQPTDQNKELEKDNPNITKTDMGTQWEFAELPNEWEPNIPTLSLPNDTAKETIESLEKSDKNKRLNLFALSDEMPSSLRGGVSSVQDMAPLKPSLTLVSEYLQNRNLRLREFEPAKKSTDDLQSIKQTILRTRASKDGKKDKSVSSADPEITLTRKKSISIYSHNTRDVVDVPYNDEIVQHDTKSNDDAYAQALQETATATNIEKEQLNKQQKDLRNRIAVTRQNVDKEYQDTLAFLNSLPKDTGNKPIKTTYMDEKQQQQEKDKQQRKMQLEFKKIERDCRKHNCKHNKRKMVTHTDTTSKSPAKDEYYRKDFEYSWLPVPESDGNLAVHTIPVKSGNTVKFTEPDTYHEYRSRHKHTPPTKDGHKNNVRETVILQNDSDNSETSSVENLSLNRENDNSELRDADRIIIYKILDSRNKRNKKKSGSTTGRSANSNNVSLTKIDDKNTIIEDKGNRTHEAPFENLQEGIYKGESSKGLFNSINCYAANVEMWHATTERKPWWDNIASMYFTEDTKEAQQDRSRQNDNLRQTCCCRNDTNSRTTDLQNEGSDNNPRSSKYDCSNCGKKAMEKTLSVHAMPSAATSATSFKTAPHDKSHFINNPNGFIKMVDEGGQETGKFYIGASGFIKDDNYEVVIQLRKKEGEKPSIESKGGSDVNIAQTIEKPEVTLPNNDKNLVEEANVSNVSKSLKERTIPLNITINDKANKTLEMTDNVEQKSTIEHTEDKNVEPRNQATCEKAVHTSFEDTFAIPVHMKKTDAPRPATSTYTQTSFNSSMQPRPVFMHMSSSTSTAYMSPPELVLPNFLKHDHISTHDELFESENTVNQTDSQYEIIRDQEYECKCKNCSCAKISHGNVICKKRKATSTPPNTARSCNGDHKTHDANEGRKRKCKCNKCSSRSHAKVCHKSHKKRSNSENTKSSNDVASDIKGFKPIKFSYKTPATNKKVDCNGNKINPIVKNYVNKLLSLNREGLKAIEIINQDCSVASTPGSSIVNVTSNKDVKQASRSELKNKISLEQIKNILKEQILQENCCHENKSIKRKTIESQSENNAKVITKLSRKKSVHKVKSLNISRKLLNKKRPEYRRTFNNSKNTTSTSSSTRDEKILVEEKNCLKSKSKISPSPRSYEIFEYKNSTSSDIAEVGFSTLKGAAKSWNQHKDYNNHEVNKNDINELYRPKDYNSRVRRPQSYVSSDSEVPSIVLKRLTAPSPTNISTQTNGSIDVETHFMKLAEDKLQNMEKIANLTEKCTKRLSNLAKVLEEVRKNKSLVYSQISTSDSASDPDNRSDKNETTMTPNPVFKIPDNIDDRKKIAKDSLDFTPILKDIPKPNSFILPSNSANASDKTSITSCTAGETLSVKAKGRPPPALSRVNLKNGPELCATPHELSTVIEVDSQMSVKFKNQSSQQDTKLDLSEQNKSNKINDVVDNKQAKTVINPNDNKEPRTDPDLLQSNATLSRHQISVQRTDSSDESKIHTMDLKQFNDIMLKPFISLQEYAKQCNIGLDEGSNVEDVMKDEPVNDELSSLHSDGSLPDVIAELLKRKMITEPFKFDSVSNVNSTTLSSESTLSFLALSKTRKQKKKSDILQKNKENVGETSETLSISSNPDLENAFQKLGMGWASSTLKKTKERLALSSSSNTSSSSLAQFKIRTFSQDVPTLVSDSTSSLLDLSNKYDRKPSPDPNMKDNSKNAVQQTSLTNSMTVKEFLTNELAKKITFSNKSTRKEDDEFISLYETKIPDNMKNTDVGEMDGDQSAASANNNRARTSTPVQIYKSTTYNSTSSSNASNGLFSNADELSSVKVTSTSMRNHSTSDKDDLTIPNYSLKIRKELSDHSKSD